MKKLLVLIAVVVLVHVASAQDQKKSFLDFHVSDITISSGKSALTSGLETKVVFSNDANGILFAQANNDRIVFNVGKRFGNLKVIESIGVFKNIPWTGPMVIYQLGPVDMMVWHGIGFAKEPTLEHPGAKPQFFFSYEEVGVTFLKHNRIGASTMWFATEKVNWFLSYRRTAAIGERSKIFAEATYNHALDIPMFVLGYSIKLKGSNTNVTPGTGTHGTP